MEAFQYVFCSFQRQNTPYKTLTDINHKDYENHVNPSALTGSNIDNPKPDNILQSYGPDPKSSSQSLPLESFSLPAVAYAFGILVSKFQSPSNFHIKPYLNKTPSQTELIEMPGLPRLSAGV